MAKRNGILRRSLGHQRMGKGGGKGQMRGPNYAAAPFTAGALVRRTLPMKLVRFVGVCASAPARPAELLIFAHRLGVPRGAAGVDGGAGGRGDEGDTARGGLVSVRLGLGLRERCGVAGSSSSVSASTSSSTAACAMSPASSTPGASSASTSTSVSSASAHAWRARRSTDADESDVSVALKSHESTVPCGGSEGCRRRSRRCASGGRPAAGTIVSSEAINEGSDESRTGREREDGATNRKENGATT
ncbi:hypothetical protein FA95DRAFT_264352 [Auriscalpium vulgare]|uniref:Uncharacterized protein n=1 Tax=Auriscalpium vulgare TaxID=40419 RepID=A0ACB8RJU2_9AGAM|nr:hypothetical protein FA95DRAFT_264352 [Auriscalpium vulgare]